MSCKTHSNSQRQFPTQSEKSSHISDPEGLQEIALRLGIGDNYDLEYKFCKPEESCPNFRGQGQTTESLVIRAPSVYSARLCTKEKTTCKAWQILLLHPLKALELQKQSPQESSTLVLAQNNINGLAFSSFGEGKFVIAEYMYIQDLKVRPSSQGLQLTASGLPNLGNTCFLNSSLQMIYSSPDMKQAAEDLSKANINSFTKVFAENLTQVLKEMDKPQLDKKTQEQNIRELMKSYDLYLEINGYGGKERFGTFKNRDVDSWELETTQKSADEFLGSFREILNLGVSSREMSFSIIEDKLSSVKANDIQRASYLQLHPDSRPIQNLVEANFVNRNPELEGNYIHRLLAEPSKGFRELNFQVPRITPDSNGNLVKNDKALSIPSDLRISIPFADPNSKKEDQVNKLYEQKMQLRSAIVHEGNSASSGHYVTYVFEDDGSVKRCSDESIQSVSKADALKAIKNNGTNLHFVKIASESPQQRREPVRFTELNLPNTLPEKPPTFAPTRHKASSPASQKTSTSKKEVLLITSGVVLSVSSLFFASGLAYQAIKESSSSTKEIEP